MTQLAKLKAKVTEDLQESLREAAEAGEVLPIDEREVVWEYPVESTFGDLATPVAFALARSLRRKPRDIAELLQHRLDLDPLVVDRIEVGGTGYLNFFLTKGFWQQVVPEILRAGGEYGRSRVGAGKRAQVEFVSANPTGPLHVGHGRGAAVGDALGNLLAALGFGVEREFYINDAGTQIEMLARSVLARYRESWGSEVAFPEEGYHGEYVRDLAARLRGEYGEKFVDLPEPECLPVISEFATRLMLAELKGDLERFGIRFDSWFSEKALLGRWGPPDQAQVRQAVRDLFGEHVYEEGGAIWLATSSFGDDKDRVLIRANGEPTYFLSDCFYHRDKFVRGFDHLIDVWGADHHGYIPRVKAALQALGYPAEALHVVVVQMVAVLRGGVPVPMSKRSGEFVTLAEVVQEVGKDAARFIFLTRRSDSPLDFDLEVAKSQSLENPVYYVQYGHARLSSVLREAEKAGLPGPYFDSSVALLDLPEELGLMKQLALYPEVVEAAALAYEPHRVPTYLQNLAGELHSYYNKYRIISADRPLSQARLALVSAVRTVLANALGLLGVAAPERM
ncbi:MAG: arginine--tRNA ligase [candidate division NC10 bacterium]|jgi:arginyl-tRNA synthetase|nr:arginine--tRNA ligase [candidate division NC10 bacterium]MCZ6550273.1 arginine--tRNA ligase [candidate division NC10 bacterium]